MGNIFWNKHEIPIPSFGKINHYDGKVSVYYKDERNRRRRHIIGHATSETTMHPNSKYRYLYPDLWKENYGEEVSDPYVIKVGLYATLLGIGYKTNLYPIIQDIFGPYNGNAIMDFSMFSIMERCNVAELFQDQMYDQMLFSRKVFDDSWYSEFFRHSINNNDIQQFRIKWLEQCKINGVSNVWLCIDGSNNNCEISESDLAEKGNAKSKLNINIVSYIWAVEASNGIPITWFVNNGAMHDSKALFEVIKFLSNSSIKVSGVILDRGFASQEIIDMICEANLSYVIMLKSNSQSYNEMLRKYADVIRWKTNHVVSKNGIFGITEKCKPFINSTEEATVGLFYDAKNGSERSLHFLFKVMSAMEDIEKQIEEDPYNVKIPSEMQKYIILHKEGKKVISAEYNNDAWQTATNIKGYCSILSSEDYSAKRIYEIYMLRDRSEKQYSIMKSQLGFYVTRVHSDQAILSRLVICFIASIIRFEIMQACQKLKLETNVIIRKLNRVQVIRMPDDRYHGIKNLSNNLKVFLKYFNIEENHLDYFAREINTQKTTTILSQKRSLPILETMQLESTRRGRPKKKKLEEENNSVKRGRGRPKGSKNKKLASAEKEESFKRKPGRPKGSKNKKKSNKLSKSKKSERGIN